MDRLTIGGLAELAGVNVETVRYYERRGLLAQPEQTGRRRYTEQSVRRLALIRRAKDLGFTLAEIGELLDATPASSAGKSASSEPTVPTAEDIVNAAHHKLKQVEATMAELAALRCRLSHLVRACAAGDSGCVTLLIESTNTSSTPSTGGPCVTSSPVQPHDIHHHDGHHDGDGRHVPGDRAGQ